MEQALGGRCVRGRLLGHGATGRVYAGRRLSDGHAVAVKVLKEEQFDDANVVGWFLQERSTLLGLDSPVGRSA